MVAGSRFPGRTLSRQAERTPKAWRCINPLDRIFGTDEPFQADALMTHCLKVLNGNESGNAGSTNDERYFMLSIIKDFSPRDAVERMLAVQMAATHVALVRAAEWMANANRLPQFEAYSTS